MSGEVDRTEIGAALDRIDVALVGLRDAIKALCDCCHPEPPVEPPVEPPTPGPPPPIPGLDSWKSRMVELLPAFNATLARTTPANFNINSHLNHDGIYSAAQGLRAHPDDPELTAYLGHQRRLYRDGYVTPNGGRVPGYYNFPEGLAYDWEHNGDAASRDALVKLRREAAYVNTQGSANEELSREVAYALLTHVECDRLGLVAWSPARVDTLLEWALVHVNWWLGPPRVWAGGSTDHIQPFMMGITGIALAKFLDHLESAKGTTDARIVPALAALAVRLRQRWWNVEGGRFYQYVYADGRLADPIYGDVLNNMIAPLFGWLYHRTGSDYFLTAGDDAFRYGIDTRDILAPKQYNENYRWTHLYVDWREAWPGDDSAYCVLDGPPAAGGAAGIASEAFFVVPLRAFTGSIVLDDGGAGGAFAPDRLTWSGTAGPKSFAYAPAVEAAGKDVVVACTNDAGLADPAAVRYRVAAAPAGQEG